MNTEEQQEYYDRALAEAKALIAREPEAFPEEGSGYFSEFLADGEACGECPACEAEDYESCEAPPNWSVNDRWRVAYGSHEHLAENVANRALVMAINYQGMAGEELEVDDNLAFCLGFYPVFEIDAE